jgi:spermidine synthase
VTIEISEAAGVRSLHFGTPWIQGSMRVARPWALELEYTRDMMLPLLLRGIADVPQRVLMVGLGAGSMLKYLYRLLPDCRFTAIELDPQVIVAAHQHFRVPLPDNRLAIHCADGYTWLEQDQGKYDLLLVDGFDHNARAHRLESVDFYRLCSARLAAGAWLSCNLLTLHRSHAATRRALQTVFGDGAYLLPPCAEGNVVALASVHPWPALDLAALRVSAATLRKQSQLNLLPLLSRLERS